jgi:hypothetical protein
MAFCDGCFELRFVDAVPLLLFAACDRFLECPLDLDLSLITVSVGRGIGDGSRFADLDLEEERWAKSRGFSSHAAK